MFYPLSFSGKLFKRYLLFPSHPAKIRVENFIGKIFFPFGIKIGNSDGVVFKLDANDWITRTMIEQGNYESASVNLGKTIMNNGGVVIDVGANFGLYSCQLAFGMKEIKLLAIEPNYLALEKLIANLKVNQLDNHVRIVNAAVTDKFQMVFLELPFANNLGSTYASTTNTDGISVLSCPLEYILELNSIREVQLLKIDIEGNEFDVFKKFDFKKFRIRNIIIEFNELSKISFADLKAFFENNGFVFFTIDGKELLSDTQNIPENNIWIVNKNFK